MICKTEQMIHSTNMEPTARTPSVQSAKLSHSSPIIRLPEKYRVAHYRHVLLEHICVTCKVGRRWTHDFDIYQRELLRPYLKPSNCSEIPADQVLNGADHG